MNKGYVVLAENTSETNYIECAEALAISMKIAMPDSSITLVTNGVSMCNAFDNVVELPYGDLAPNSKWKLINDWQVYDASPYHYTIKLEADMYIPADIDYWFDILSLKEVCVCTTIRDYKNNLTDSRVYRKFIDDNNLPDVYNAITYFKKSDMAKTFFLIVRNVFEHWDEYKTILKCNKQEEVTTDWAYAIASHILGIENTTLPNFNEFSMVHMKQFIIGTIVDDWTNELIYEFGDPLRIQTIPQKYPVHYNIKTFGKKIKDHYGRI